MDLDRTRVPNCSLHDGIEIPQLGFGAFQVRPGETQRTVEMALEAGYRHFDTAAAYRNERAVGAALAASGLPREDYFVTTKLASPQPDAESTLAAFEASLDRLDLDHVDLYLIHQPGPARDRIADTWRAFEWIHGEEAARAIGVANFGGEDLALLEREMETRPAINQVELHPHFQQVELRARHAGLGIATGAWSPLAQGKLLADPTIGRLAYGHGKTPSQVILRWHLQLGNVVIPRAATPEEIRENIEIFDFQLSAEEMAEIGELDRGRRIRSRQTTFVAP
jgi:2,5-diketo-D-gluconate reductase A